MHYWQGRCLTYLMTVAFILLACTQRTPPESASIGELRYRDGTPVQPLVVGVGTVTILQAPVKLEPPHLQGVQYRWQELRLETTGAGVRETPDHTRAGEMVGLPPDQGGEYHAPAQGGTIHLILSVWYKDRLLARRSFPIDVVDTDLLDFSVPEGTRVHLSVDQPATGERTLPGSPPPASGAQESPARAPMLLSPAARTVPDALPPSARSVEDPQALAVTIRSPQGGESVPHVMTVEGQVRALHAGEHLALLVRPIADPQELQAWVVQSNPERHLDGTWSSTPVVLGLPDDLAGSPVRLCVLMTPEPLVRGQHLAEFPPATSSYCVEVRRR